MKKNLFYIILVIAITISIPSIKQFTITNKNTGKLVYCDSVDNFQYFCISFIHSVNKTVVNEFYRTIGDNFVVYKTTFCSYGAGMPDVSEIPGADMKCENGKIKIDNIDRILNEFTYFVGTSSNHTLYATDNCFMLKQYVKPQEPAIFKIKRVSIFEVLRRRFNE